LHCWHFFSETAALSRHNMGDHRIIVTKQYLHYCLILLPQSGQVLHKYSGSVHVCICHVTLLFDNSGACTLITWMFSSIRTPSQGNEWSN
jgi:hypothetical protein